jgi:uncharacterized protein (UPF0548 family)
MEHVCEYFRNAADCLMAGRSHRNQVVRAQYLELAAQWARLAAARESLLTDRVDIQRPAR